MTTVPAAGIIPYIILPTGPIFLLGLEKSNHKWSGFVGGYEKKDKNIMETAVREFNEETALIFEDLIPWIHKKIQTLNPVIETTQTNRVVYLWFIEFPVSVLQRNIQILFLENKKNLDKYYNEKNILKWFTLKQIENSNVLYKLKKTILRLF